MVLIGSYLLTAFSGAKLATEVQVVLFAAVLLLIAFSFTTLTTLGYGDFTAAESGGRSIAVLEALTGQIFLATLVARLVAAYRTPDRPEPKPEPEPSGGRWLLEDVDGPGDDEDRD